MKMSDDQDWQSILENDYHKNEDLYNEYCDELKKQLEQLFRKSDISIAVPIGYRVKSLDSVISKCIRNSISPITVDEINDFAGIRIVLLFKRDEEPAHKLIEETFDILEKEDTLNRLGDNQFGYGSVHYLLKPPQSWFGTPSLSNFQGLKVEVQVRTSSQHMWAQASHILQYKKEEDVPLPLRRAINRVAALLEIVDLEFDRLLSDRKVYVDKIQDRPKAEDLNADVLRSTLDRILPSVNKSYNEPYAELLDDLRVFKINTVEIIEDLISTYIDEIRREDARVGQQSRREHYYTHVGMVRLALSFRFGKVWRSYNMNRTNKRDSQGA